MEVCTWLEWSLEGIQQTQGRKASCPNPFKLGGQGEERTEVCAHRQTGPVLSEGVAPVPPAPPLLLVTEHLNTVTCRVSDLQGGLY